MDNEERRARMRDNLQLHIKIDRLQAAGDGLAEFLIDVLDSMWPEQASEANKLLADWNQAKETK